MDIKRFIFLLFCCLPVCVYAQTEIKGTLYKAGTSTRLSQALITNIKTKTIMMSDELGIFGIKANPGDTLLFTKKGYAAYKQVIPNNNDLLIYLQPAAIIELDEVKVTGQTKGKELADVLAAYRSQGTFFNGKPPALLFLMSPLTGLYELMGRTPGNARRFVESAKKELAQSEINKRYNTEFVKRITGLPSDTAAHRFMEFYTPAYEDIKKWNDYELVKRTKRQFEFYKKRNPASMPKPLIP